MIIICFGSEWDSWLRRSNRILLGLCRSGLAEHVVFFEKPLTLRNIWEFFTGKANYTIEERSKRLFRKGPWSRVADNVTAVTPVIPAVFFRSPRLQAINEWIRTVQHLLFLKILQRKWKGGARVLLWLQRPEFNSRYLKRIPHWKALYDCTEDYVELLGNENPALLGKYKKDDSIITENAHAITTVSREYASVKGKENPNTHWISNGVDFDEFSGFGDNGGTGKGKGGRHVLSFLGILNRRHDLDLILELAESYPECVIELVGPANDYVALKAAEKAVSNIRFIPGIAAKDVPRYIRRVDVCLSLFKCDYLNRSCSSMKNYQYMAAGKPVVSYPVADSELFGDVIYLAKNRREYIELVGLALKEPGDDPKAVRRMEYARQNDWSVKVREFEDLLRNMAGEGDEYKR